MLKLILKFTVIKNKINLSFLEVGVVFFVSTGKIKDTKIDPEDKDIVGGFVKSTFYYEHPSVEPLKKYHWRVVDALDRHENLYLIERITTIVIAILAYPILAIVAVLGYLIARKVIIPDLNELTVKNPIDISEGIIESEHVELENNTENKLNSISERKLINVVLVRNDDQSTPFQKFRSTLEKLAHPKVNFVEIISQRGTINWPTNLTPETTCFVFQKVRSTRSAMFASDGCYSCVYNEKKKSIFKESPISAVFFDNANWLEKDSCLKHEVALSEDENRKGTGGFDAVLFPRDEKLAEELLKKMNIPLKERIQGLTLSLF